MEHLPLKDVVGIQKGLRHLPIIFQFPRVSSTRINQVADRYSWLGCLGAHFQRTVAQNVMLSQIPHTRQ